MSLTSSSIGISDFACAFGDDEDEVARLCGQVIRTRDVSYRISSQETREQIFLDVLTKFDKGEFSVSDARRSRVGLMVERNPAGISPLESSPESTDAQRYSR